MHFISKEHCPSVSFFWCYQKVLRLQIYCLELEESRTNLFSLIPGPRQGWCFSSQTCLYVPWSFKAMYSNCSYRRTGLESTDQWELGSHGDKRGGAEEYPTQSWRKFWVFSILFPINRYICLWFKTLVENYLESQLTNQLVHYRVIAKVVIDLLQKSYLVDTYGNTETFPGVILSTWSLNPAPGPVTERWKIGYQVWRCSKLVGTRSNCNVATPHISHWFCMYIMYNMFIYICIYVQEEMSITSDMQMIPPLWQKVKRN